MNDIVIKKPATRRPIFNNSVFSIGDFAIVFNAKEWCKTGDLPEGNGKYYQRAKVIDIYKRKNGEWLADVIFDKSELESRGHFQSGMARCI